MAWNKLHGVVTSQLSVEVEVDGKVQKLPMPAVINLRSHPDEPTRRRGYEAEMQAWPKIQESLAACMNGVKGTVNTLNKHRGRKDALHSSLDQARIDSDTLEAMLDAMQSAFPTIRRYFHSKAKRIDKEQLAWWDLFAPVGKLSSHYSYDEAHRFILEQFEGFSPELAAFASNAFEKRWIDAEQRDGKQGGAYCMGVPKVKESRIMCNFDGSMDQVSTLAHELGHGFHDHCAYEFSKTQLQQRTPMTLAETASIMCETVITNALLKEAKDPQEILFILEQALISDSQLIVDIYSRYLFEKEVFERREKSELSAEELCDIMSRAQKATYGDGVDERYLQPYMWAWKPHYYYADLSFYNFPYTFGGLFGTGLYAVFQERGQAFIPEYKQLLASTGEGSTADLAARFGLNIRRREFWENSLKVVSDRIEQYIKI
jgi:pepF/M3 family oligoendopeptidase